MKSRALNIVLIITILVTSASTIYIVSKIATQKIRKEYLILATKYDKTRNESYFWQLLLLNPSRNNMSLALDKLITSGDIKSAELLNAWIRNPEFNLKVVESSVLNHIVETNSPYFEGLNEVQKDEIYFFLALNKNDYIIPTFELPTTNLGKIATMIHQDNFYLYKVENIIGAEIYKQTNAHKNKTEERLAIASIFFNYGYHGIALNLIETTDKETPCLNQSLFLKIKIHEEQKEYDKLIESIESHVRCYPADVSALEKAINITEAQGLDPTSYKTRLNELKKIKNK